MSNNASRRTITLWVLFKKEYAYSSTKNNTATFPKHFKNQGEKKGHIKRAKAYIEKLHAQGKIWQGVIYDDDRKTELFSIRVYKEGVFINGTINGTRTHTAA